MKNNEPLNSSDISDHPENDPEMTAEEYRLYREILDAAYPKPGRDIKSSVMAAIRSESDAVILSAEKKKNKWRTAAVKWGSLAASIAIVALVGIKVLPAFLSTDNIAYDTAGQEAKIYASSTTSADTAYNEAPAETGADKSTSSVLYKSFAYTTASGGSAAIAEDEAAEEEAAEEAAEFDIGATEAYSEDLETVPECEDVSAEAEEADYASYEMGVECAEETEAAVFTTAAYADYGDASKNAASNSIVTPVISCNHTEVFRDSYHEIPGYLIEEVGEDEYCAWANEVSREDSCAVNIASFIEHFGIPESTFAMYMSTTDIAYYCDYPLDVLYSGDDAAIEEYYANGGRYDEMVKDYFEYELKLALVKELGTAAYTEWLDEIGCSSVRGWSISQMVQNNGIDEAEFLEIYDETVGNFPEEYDGYDLPEYNTAMLYVGNAAVQIALAMSADGYAADAACRK